MDKYQDAIECASYLLTLYDKLTKKQIAQYDYPWNMFLYAFYNYTKELDQFDLNQINNERMWGFNILLLSINYGKLKVVKYLISRNVNLYVKESYNGNNIYMLAAYVGNLKMLKYLDTIKIIKEDNIFYFSINSAGETIYSLALAYDNSNSLTIIKYLESRGINIHNKSLCYVHYFYNNKIISYLYSRGYRFKNLKYKLIFVEALAQNKIHIWNGEYKYSGHILYIN
jgi:ankyrin repeat protein